MIEEKMIKWAISQGFYDEELGIRVQVNPDRSKEGVPYFKVFNDTKIKVGETKVSRFHFTDDKMEYHNDKYLDWNITNDDIKNIHIFMSKKKIFRW